MTESLRPYAPCEPHAVPYIPYVLEETDFFAVVFKPAKMHCDSAPQGRAPSGRAPAKGNLAGGESLAEWGFGVFHSMSRCGGGLVHRLDFETQGLVLFAKNRQSRSFFKALQDGGGFVKEYGAVCEKAQSGKPGFPPAPVLSGRHFVIESFFRPFGPGRKQVRPVLGRQRGEFATDRGAFYKTEVIEKNGVFFRVRLKRGFRHQIRCHLSWIGFPILNDPLYGFPLESGVLALRACALFFADPQSGEKREYRIEPFCARNSETQVREP